MIDIIRPNKKIIVICGHYGVGKTNFAVNLAVHFKTNFDKIYTLVDLDIVNPYFRAADSQKFLADYKIDMIVPQFANTNVDVPSIPPQVYSIFIGEQHAIIDVGGDDTGAVALGMLSEKIDECGYEMLFVINNYRIQIQEVNDAVNMAHEIEKKSKLKFTGVINNSHLGKFTDMECIRNSKKYAETVSQRLNIPLIATTVKSDIYLNLHDNTSVDIKEDENYFIVEDYIKKYF